MTPDAGVGESGRAALALENARLRRQLQEASTRRDQFLLDLAKEWHTTLAMMRGGLHTLEQPTATPQQAVNARAQLERSLRYLEQFARDLFAWGHARYGGRELALETVELGAIVAEVAEQLAARRPAPCFRLRWSALEVPFAFTGDSRALVCAISALIAAVNETESEALELVVAGRRTRDHVEVRVWEIAGRIRHSFALASRVFGEDEPPVEPGRLGSSVLFALADRQIRAQYGTLSVSPEEPDGTPTGRTEFVIRLPVLTR